MEDLLRQILRKLDEIEQRIAAIEDEIASYEEVAESPFDEFDREVEELVPKAVMMIESLDKITYGMLQRKLDCGYSYAARVAERLAEMGLIMPDPVENFYTVNTEEVRKYLHKSDDKNKWN